MDWFMVEMFGGVGFQVGDNVEPTSVSAQQWRNTRKPSEGKVKHIYLTNCNIILHIFGINLPVNSILIFWIGSWKKNLLLDKEMHEANCRQ